VSGNLNVMNYFRAC